MAKAILELEMPESCWKCPCSWRMKNDVMICEVIMHYCPEEGRRPDCPLKVNEQSNDVEQRLAKGGVAFVVACDKTGMLKYATSLVRKMFNTEEDACVLCGSYVPEGRMVCSVCEKDPFHVLRKEQNYEKG